MRAFYVAAIAAVALVGWPVVASAQRRQPEKPAAITDVAEAGSDYWLQGEYAGWLHGSPSGSGPVGLQVVALGDGKFDAVRYRGGLPGNGWDRGEKLKLSGAVESGRLTLTGGGETLLVGGGQAVAVDNFGRETGRLTMMQRSSTTMGLAP